MFALTMILWAGPVPVATVPQDPAQRGGLVAEFRVGGQRQTLSRDEVALFLARRHRNSPTGKDTVDHLIEVILVRKAAQAAGMMPTGAEVRAEIRRIEAAMKQRNMQLDDLLDRTRLSRAEFADKTALGIAQRRMASKVLNIDPDKVSAEHLALWTKEQRNKVAIITDPAHLGPGVLAKVGTDAEISALDVGRVLFTKMTPAGLAESINRLVFERCIAYEANRHGIELTAAELEAQYQQNKQAFEASATNQGVAYEKWLAALGSSKAKELGSNALRTRLLHGKLVRRRYPDSLLDQRLADNRAALLRRHGARRALSILFVRATERPNKILRRDFKAARAHIEDIRRSIVDKRRSFALMAKINSDDQATKAAGGKIGWQHEEYLPHARGRRAPPEVLKAAFALPIGEVSAPIQTAEGFYLVWVSGIEPEPDRERLRARLLGEMADRYNRELYEAAKVDIKIK